MSVDQSIFGNWVRRSAELQRIDDNYRNCFASLCLIIFKLCLRV